MAEAPAWGGTVTAGGCRRRYPYFCLVSRAAPAVVSLGIPPSTAQNSDFNCPIPKVKEAILIAKANYYYQGHDGGKGEATASSILQE